MCEREPRPAPAIAKAPFDGAQARRHQEAWAAHLGVPVEHTNSLGMKFRLIPPGEFQMGGTPEEIDQSFKGWGGGGNKYWQGLATSEGPQHSVVLTQPWYLGIHEVTQSQYEQIMGKNPSDYSANGRLKGKETSNLPVDNVSWYDVAEFCEKLSQQEKLRPFGFRKDMLVVPLAGNGYRLPTEAEWEYACRAGTTTRYWCGPGDKELVRGAWTIANSGNVPHPVGTLEANPFGLFDLHGNAWEWVEDCWEPEIYGRTKPDQPAINPGGRMTSGQKKVTRGGSCVNYMILGRAASRASNEPEHANVGVHGFRVVLTVEAVKQAAAK